MHWDFRKIAWLAIATAVVLSLTLGAILAHEGRPVGDYRLIVGWMEEPAYEGSQNAVSIRVNKIVEGEAAESESESGGADHGAPGHHEEDPEGTPAMSHEEQESGESEGHHGTEDSDGGQSGGHHGGEQEGDGDEAGEGQGHNGTEDSGEKQNGMASMTQGADGHHDGAVEAANAMSVSVEAVADSVSGINVHVMPLGFTFAPESVNGENVDGEGHARVYVDGVKISRVYTPWLYLGEVEPGEHEIRVILNANSHGEYTYGDEKVEATTHITVPEPHGHSHAPETVEVDSGVSVTLRVETDAIEGGNLFVESSGFTFAPQNAGGNHVAGQGHAHVYVNGVKVGRLYGNALQLGKLAVGENKVRVTLNANDHAAYTHNGAAIEVAVAIDIPEELGGAGYGNPPSTGDKGSDKTDADVDHMEGEPQNCDPSGEENGMVEKDGDSHEDSHQSKENDSDGQSSVVLPQGGGKPLASVAGQGEEVAVPVEGLEGSLQVEVTHVSSGVSRTFDLQAAWGEPGHYVAGLIPTASGVYEFRFFGTIDGLPIDETFVSQGGGGDFDDVRSSAELQFPVQLPEIREIESGARGALSTAQEAQQAAIAAQAAAGSAQGGGNVLAIVALIIGIVGAIAGGGGLYIALRVRNSP